MISTMLAMTGWSQSSATLMTNSGDTVTNTGTKYLLQKVDTKTVDLVSFHLVNKRVSGTTAGKSYFEVSNNGLDDDWVVVDSLTNSVQGTNKKIFVDNPAKYLWYRIRTTGTGTMVMTTKGYGILRKNK